MSKRVLIALTVAVAAGTALFMNDRTEAANNPPAATNPLLEKWTGPYGGVLPFDLANKEMTDILFQQRVQPKIREYLTKLRDEGFIDVRAGYVDTGASQKSTRVSEVEPPK